MTDSNSSLFGRHEFLIRRIHSLTGLVPVGLYMVVHLTTNMSILNGVESFQNLVYQIHSLGNFLWIVEWLFIFLPILFHAVLGFVIIFGGKSNIEHYPRTANIRYTLQRISGIIAFLFIGYHVLHMHGLIHIEAWQKYASDSLGLAQFAPYSAASTAAAAMQSSILVPAFYLFGCAACVFHFANGLWTMGITWGVWTSPKAQQRATMLCAGIGVTVMLIATGAVYGFYTVDVDKARDKEMEMFEERVKGGFIPDNREKLSEEALKVIERSEK